MWQQWYHSNSPCASALIHRFQYQSFRGLHMDPTCAFVRNLNQPYLLFTIQNIRSSKTPKVQAGQTGEFTLKITYCIITVQTVQTTTFFFWVGFVSFSEQVLALIPLQVTCKWHCLKNPRNSCFTGQPVTVVLPSWFWHLIWFWHWNYYLPLGKN